MRKNLGKEVCSTIGGGTACKKCPNLGVEIMS